MLLFLRQLFMMHVCVCVCVCVHVCVCVVIVHWHCSAQLSMFNMEKRYRNKIIIIIKTHARLKQKASCLASFGSKQQQPFLKLGATRGVSGSTSAFLACHQCCCGGSSLARGLNLRALVCGIF